MKKLLFVCIVVGAVGWVARDIATQKVVGKIEMKSPSPSPIAKTPKAATKARKPNPDEASDIFNEDGSLKRLPAGTKVYHFWGYVRQQLDDGCILVECGTTDAQLGEELRIFQYRALLTRGEANDLIDGSQVRFSAIPCGVYQYTDVTGATRTIRKLLFIPPEAMPDSKLSRDFVPPSAEGVFALYPPGVDTPEDRREYLLQQIESKKNGTAPAPRTSNRTRGY